MVTIFGIDTCLYCLKCKQLCEALEIEHDYLDLSEPEVSSMFRSLFPQQGEIPQVLWENKHIGGYPELKRKIDEYIINLDMEK
jgi:glutaredoxin